MNIYTKHFCVTFCAYVNHEYYKKCVKIQYSSRGFCQILPSSEDNNRFERENSALFLSPPSETAVNKLRDLRA